MSGGISEFWRHKTLEEMTRDEWESLCDGCARCCLLKIAPDDSGDVRYTAARCELLDDATCRCTRYEQRTRLVKDCVRVTPALAREASWLPSTCAYRRLGEGKDLPEWHPLRTGDERSVLDAGMTIRGRSVSSVGVHPDSLPEMVINWVNG